MDPKRRLVECLVSEGLINNAVDEVQYLAEDQQPIACLSSKRLLDETQAILAVAKKLGIEYLDLDLPEILTKLETKKFASKVDSKLCWSNKIVPLFEDKFSIFVAQANPFDHEILMTLRYSLDKPLVPVISEESKITRLLKTHFSPLEAEIADADEIPSLEITVLPEIDEDLDKIPTDAAPVVRLVHKIIADAIAKDASDIHVEPSTSGLDVRFRIDGVMERLVSIPKRLQSYVTARFKIVSGMDIAEKRRPQDGRLRVKFDGRSVDMRVSAIPVANGEKIVLRLLRDDYENLTLGALGFPNRIEEAVRRALRNDSKLFLVTGPTGSGKTTTLYTCLNQLRDGKTNITTVEDPVEYKFRGINQTQVNSNIGVTFASALRSLLRQDPDVIMVGEIRDSETAQIALQAAQTGHLMVSTLHTNNAPSAVARLFDLGAEPYAVAESLVGVLAQRLVRKICESCKTSGDKGFLEEDTPYLEHYEVERGQLWSGAGCAECGFSGFKGRTGVYSYLEITEDIAGIIATGGGAAEITSAARREGFVDLDIAAIALLTEGQTSFDEVRAYLRLGKQQGVEKKEPSAEILQRDSQGVAFTDPLSEAKILAKPRVLLIDDSEMTRKLIATILSMEMFEVVEAENGEQGLEKVYEHQPEVILCDLTMPVMDGRSFLKKLRNTKGICNIPVVILTGDISEDNEAELLSLGAKDFVRKNASPKVIVGRIQKAIGNV